MTRVCTNLHGCFVVTFFALHIYFIYVKRAYFATLMKYILKLLVTLFCENVCRLIRLIKLWIQKTDKTNYIV
jgi:hypothetical protein